MVRHKLSNAVMARTAAEKTKMGKWDPHVNNITCIDDNTDN
jgi:hypothetical protein